MFCNDSAESKLMASTGDWDCDRERGCWWEMLTLDGIFNVIWNRNEGYYCQFVSTISLNSRELCLTRL